MYILINDKRVFILFIYSFSFLRSLLTDAVNLITRDWNYLNICLQLPK